MSGCKIGKITYKTGNVVKPIFGKDLTLHIGKDWEALHQAIDIVKNGEAAMVAVVVKKKNGDIYHDFNKLDNISGSDCLGCVTLLKDFIIGWLRFN